MNLSLSSRPCLIGASINTRTEKHGDEDVPAVDIPVAGIMLTAEELGALVGDAYAHKALFDTKGKRMDPALPYFESFQLKHKFEGAAVDFELGLHKQHVGLDGAKLAGIKLTPRAGGLTEMSCKVQCVLHAADDVGQLIQHLNREAQIEVTDAAQVEEKASSKQQDLPINNFGDGEQPEGDTGKGKRRGRKPRDGAEATH